MLEQFIFDAAFNTKATFPPEGNRRMLKIEPDDFRFSNEILVTRMLNSSPVSDFRKTALLKKLRPTDFAMLLHFWKLA